MPKLVFVVMSAPLGSTQSGCRDSLQLPLHQNGIAVMTRIYQRTVKARPLWFTRYWLCDDSRVGQVDAICRDFLHISE